MGTDTKIEWCDHTFNPWIGCAKVAAGCTNCYAEALMDKRYGKAKWGENGTRVKTSKGNWAKVRAWNREALATFGRKARVFCASLADVAEDRPELVPWRAELCDLIRECGNLDFLLLTKRPENLTRLFPADVLARCWVGTSVAEQKDADKNIPHLLACPAAVRFVSAEPLIGPANVKPYLYGNLARAHCLDWVIVGGESGPGARLCDVAWIRSIVGQCKAAGVPCFVKQLGARPFSQEPAPRELVPQASMLRAKVVREIKVRDGKGGDPAEWPEDLRIRQFPTLGQSAGGEPWLTRRTSRDLGVRAETSRRRDICGVDFLHVEAETPQRN
jgi:protein gp37